jgi:Carboxypeptidase regulatory-like domain
MKSTTPRISITVGVLLLVLSAPSLAGDQPKTTSMKGKVFRSDTKQPIANGVIILLDQKKSDKQDNSIDTKTDDQGNYSFPNVSAGTYTISIRAWYTTQEDAPCQLLIAKTADKNSTVAVMRDKDKFV